MRVGSTKLASMSGSIEALKGVAANPEIEDFVTENQPLLSRPRALQFWTGAMVVLPVFLQASWAHLEPLSACFFTLVILCGGITLSKKGEEKWFEFGSLLIGVSGSWLGGCLFWGWLRSQPILHIPVESIVLPIAIVALGTKWRLGAAFYLSCLLGTALTDLMMVLTGVMDQWPIVVNAPIENASNLLHQTALNLINSKSILLLISASSLIIFLSYKMRQRAILDVETGKAWIVASAALTTTLWVDGLFLLTALFGPAFSGLL